MKLSESWKQPWFFQLFATLDKFHYFFLSQQSKVLVRKCDSHSLYYLISKFVQYLNLTAIKFHLILNVVSLYVILSYSIFLMYFFKNSLCGYQIRMESRTGEATRLLYCTTGVLLRKLQEDGLLSSISHIIVDEVISSLLFCRNYSYSGPWSVLNSCYRSVFLIVGTWKKCPVRFLASYSERDLA